MFVRLSHALMAFLLFLMINAPTQAQETNNKAAHPRVLLDSQTLAKIKEKSANATPTKFGFKTSDIWNGILTNADRLAAAPTYSYQIAIPGEGGVTLENWSYTLSNQTPPPHEKSPNYPPWTAMFQERADSITTRLVHFSFAYLITGEDRYFQKAREIALSLSKWNAWTDMSYGAGSIKACLDTGHCTYAVAMFYDWCFDHLTDAEKAELQQALVSKGIEPILGYVDHYPPDTNGYAVLLSGVTLAAIAIQPEEPRSAEFLKQSIDKIRVSLDRGAKDGGMFEGPMYGTYLIDSLALCFDALEAASVPNDLLQHPYIATMPRYCLGLLAPDTRQIPCFSDGSPGVAVPKLMSILAQRGSKESAYYLQLISALKPDDIYDFIRFDAAQLDPQPPTWNPSTVFTEIGYASLRDRFNASAPSLFFKSGPLTNDIGHNHYDHNSFVVSYGGQWVVPDRGYHNFYIPAKRKFSLGTIGHNSMVMDVDDAWIKDTTVPSLGHDQVNRASGKISEFFAGDSFDYVKGEAAAPYNDEKNKVLNRYDRSIVYIKPHFFIIRDELASLQPHSYNFLLHSDGVGEIEQEGNGFHITRTNAQIFARVQSSGATAPHIGTYPGAEDYGPFLRVESAKASTVNYTSFLYPQPYQNPKFLQNGGFESELAGWTPRSGSDLKNHSVVDINPAEGKRVARIETSGYLYSAKFPQPVGTKLTARVKIRTEGAPQGKGATMHIYFWRGGKSFDQAYAGPFNTEQWTEQTISATVPEGTDEVSLALEYFAPGAGYFDDVRFESDAKVTQGITPVVKPLGNDGMDVTIGQERFVVLCGESGKDREAGGLKTDAAIAVVGLDSAGKPISSFLQNGKSLQWNGENVLGFEKAVTAEAHLKGGTLTLQVMTDVTPHASVPTKLPVRATLYKGWKPQQIIVNGKKVTITTTGIG